MIFKDRNIDDYEIVHFLSMNKIKKGGGSANMSEFTMDVASGSIALQFF